MSNERETESKVKETQHRKKNPISMKVDNTCLQKRLKFVVPSLRWSSFSKQHWAGRDAKEEKLQKWNLFSLKMPQRPLRSWLVIPRINTKYYLIFYAVFEITKENEENKHEQEWDCKPEIYDSFFRSYFLFRSFRCLKFLSAY